MLLEKIPYTRENEEVLWCLFRGDFELGHPVPNKSRRGMTLLGSPGPLSLRGREKETPFFLVTWPEKKCERKIREEGLFVVAAFLC